MVMQWVKRLVRQALCGAALLAGASLVNAQGGSVPPAPQGPWTSASAAQPGASLPPPQAPAAAPRQYVVSEDQLRALIQSGIKDYLQSNPPALTPAPAPAPIAPAPIMPAATTQDQGQPGGMSGGMSQPPDGQTIRQLFNRFKAEDAQAQAKKDAEDKENYKVGTDLRMFGTWKDGMFLESPNKDFYVHIGGEMQYDNQFWGRGSPLTAPSSFAANTTNTGLAPVNGAHSGIVEGGIGELVDADYFRRLRLWAEGGFWEIGEFMFQPKFEKIDVNGSVGLDEMWVGVTQIPFLGTIRVGHHKTPQGLESDDWSSNRTFTYMERSSMSNAFFQNFGTGIIFTNNIAEDWIGQRATYATFFYKPQDGENGAEYADGDYAFTGRLSGLPIYQNDGRHLLHLAASFTYRHNRNGNATVSCTPEMFDYSGGDNGDGIATAAGAASGGTGTKATNVSNMNPSVQGVLAGNSNPNGANATALLSTGSITSAAEMVTGLELLYICGPFSVQAEYAFLTFVDSEVAGDSRGANLTVAGGYISLNYILTGENRTYDTRLGRIGTDYLRVNTPFWLVRDQNGGFNGGWGAWEIETRFSHLDLNTSGINGGVSDAWNFGLVWHLNNNLRVTLDYLVQNRYNTPASVNTGVVDGIGLRTQLQF